MAFLQRVYGDRRDSIYEIDDVSITIGRHKDCEVVIDSQAVSRRHAEIYFDGDAYFLRDLDSRNGTVVDGKPVTGTIQLRDWHRIEFSTLAFEFNRHTPLDEESASQNISAAVIAVQNNSVEVEGLIDHRVVSVGDEIPVSDVQAGRLVEQQVAARTPIVRGESGWPIIADSTLKLNLAMRLVSSLRRVIRLEETVDEVQKSILELIAPVDCVAVALRSPTDGRTRIVAAATRDSQHDVEVCVPLVASAMLHSEALFYLDQRSGRGRMQLDVEESTLRYIICVPLLDALGGALGAIQIDTGLTARSFDRAVMEKMVILGQLVSVFLENAMELELEIEQAQTEQSEDSANRLRGAMGCASPPKTEGFYISQQMISRQQTSEVLVDYINLPGRRVAAYVLDVEGSTCAVERSVRAARLMVESLVTTCSATEAVQNLAEQLDSDPQGQADTVAAGVVIVDQERSTVSIATNGQCPGLVVKAGHVESDTSELSACCRRAVTHEAGEFEDIPLQEDECLVLFSEGVTRLIGGNGQLLSTTELGALVENALTDATGNPESAIVQALNRYRGVTPLADDIAVIVVSRDGQSSFRATQVGGDTRMDVQEQK